MIWLIAYAEDSFNSSSLSSQCNSIAQFGKGWRRGRGLLVLPSCLQARLFRGMLCQPPYAGCHARLHSSRGTQELPGWIRAMGCLDHCRLRDWPVPAASGQRKRNPAGGRFWIACLQGKLFLNLVLMGQFPASRHNGASPFPSTSVIVHNSKSLWL